MATRVLFTGEDRFLARIAKIRDSLKDLLAKALNTIGARVTGRAKEKASGEVLNPRSGTLRGKIHTVQEAMGNGTVRQLVGLSLKYARIHEYGGTIKHPGSTKFQAWMGQGAGFTFNARTLKGGYAIVHKSSVTDWIYTKGTRPHDIVIPERSYLRSSLKELTPWAIETVRGKILKAIKA